METFLTYFEFAASIFEGFILVKFIFDYCGYRIDKIKRIWALLFSQMLFSLTIITLNIIVSFESIGVLLFVAVLFIIARLFLQGSWLQHLFVSVFAILYTVLIAAATMTMTAAVSHQPLQSIYGQVSIARAIGVLITKILEFVVFHIVAAPKKQREKVLLTNGEWGQVVFVSFLSIVLIDTAINLQLNYLSPLMNGGVIFIILGVLAVNIYFLYVVLKINRYNRIKQENDLLRQQALYQAKYAESVNSQYRAIRALRHDWKHALAVLGVLIDEGKNTEATSFIRQYTETSDNFISYIETDNELLNAIVNSKMTQAHQHDLHTTCVVTSACHSIEPVDLCNLIGNLLDNAIEGAEKAYSKSGEISLQITEDESRVLIAVKNTISKSVLADNAELTTTKNDREHHGFGMQTIRNIVEKYNGFLDISEKDSNFCISIVLFV